LFSSAAVSFSPKKNSIFIQDNKGDNNNASILDWMIDYSSFY